MLARKYLKEHCKKVKLSDEGEKQYDIAAKEIDRLSDFTPAISWWMMTDEFYDKSVNLSVIEGIIYGVALTGIFTLLRKGIRAKREKSKEES